VQNPQVAPVGITVLVACVGNVGFMFNSTNKDFNNCYY